MAKSQQEKQFVQMAGEFGAASELFRRQMQACITYGNSKSADLYVLSTDGSRAVKLEVKSASIKSWIVGQQALTPASHRLWIFAFQPKPPTTISPAQVAENGSSAAQYFVLTSDEVRILYQEKLVAGPVPQSELIEAAEEQGTSTGPESDQVLKDSAAASSVIVTFKPADIQHHFNRWDKVTAALAQMNRRT